MAGSCPAKERILFAFRSFIVIFSWILSLDFRCFFLTNPGQSYLPAVEFEFCQPMAIVYPLYIGGIVSCNKFLRLRFESLGLPRLCLDVDLLLVIEEYVLLTVRCYDNTYIITWLCSLHHLFV